MNLRAELERRIAAALVAAGAPGDAPPLVGPSTRPEFGDYQANGAMAAGKRLKTNPRELAGNVVEAAEMSDLASNVEIAGPGFINVTLKSDFLARQLAEDLRDERLGEGEPVDPQTVVVDYSGPNLAKEMHVGHLRSTIIGDALARILEFQGHNVIRQNHVGDWGTQFGMLTAFLDVVEQKKRQEHGAIKVVRELTDLEGYYRDAKRLFDEEPHFADISREYVVRLQAKEPKVLHSWERFTGLSLAHMQDIYERLGVSLSPGDVRGESFYNAGLPKVIEALDEKGLLTESQGAKCVFMDEFTGKDGEPLPLIVRKSDGGYLYATTDLAAIRYRVGELAADRILYVTDSRQSLHFQQVFAVARAAGFAPDDVSLEHVPFGTMLGDDRKPFKTRTGGTVKLMDLLDEAERRARHLVEDKNPELDPAERDNVARIVGMGAVKYADLSQNRTSDYVFSWDKMLTLDGNTAPYMQYAYARIRSIFRKGRMGEHASVGEIVLDDPAERALAVKLLQLPETIDAVARDSAPNQLCAYLYELAGAFMGFYENCPVLQSDEPIRSSRLRLCDLTARAVRKGLELLGIETLEQM